MGSLIYAYFNPNEFLRTLHAAMLLDCHARHAHAANPYPNVVVAFPYNKEPEYDTEFSRSATLRYRAVRN